ncbi:MAG TPA: ATP-binding protein, partial [Capsulimonadaceae bacterium]|nr:ATP-binding protein [Capsulimonadaceae bacterium]
PNDFNESVIQMLQLMAGLISAAMEHASQFQERREAELELQRILAQTEQVLIAIPSILIEIDENGCVTTWNAAASKAFGLSRNDVHGKQLEECEISWDPAIIQGVETCQKGHQIVRVENVKYTNTSGKDRLLGVTITPIITNAGTYLGLLILAADVTDRLTLEGQLAQAQKLESIGHLAAGIAHEINTPIQYIGDNTRFLQDAFADLQTLLMAYADFAEGCKKAGAPSELVRALDDAVAKADVDYLTSEIPTAIQQSLEGVQRVANIVLAMKEFSHPGTSEKTSIDLNHAIESTITVARNEWKYVADLITDLDPDLPLVPCLPGDLNQVFLNLIVNAAHAVGDVVRRGDSEKGTITVRTRRYGGFAEIAIEDTGSGVPQEVRSRLFDPFFTTKEVGKGTGQGLAIARSVVVNKHGGTIHFDSEVGKGTTFIVRLPLAADVEEAA